MPNQWRTVQIWLLVGGIALVALFPFLNYVKVLTVESQIERCGRLVNQINQTREREEAAASASRRLKEARQETQLVAQLAACERHYLALCGQISWDWKSDCTPERQDDIFGAVVQTPEVVEEEPAGPGPSAGAGPLLGPPSLLHPSR